MRVRRPLRRRPWRRGPADSYPHGACVPPADLRQRLPRQLSSSLDFRPPRPGQVGPRAGAEKSSSVAFSPLSTTDPRVTPGPQSPHGHSGAVTFPRLLPEWPQGHLGRSHRQVACPPRWPRGHPGGGHLAGKSPAGHSEKSPPGDLRLKSDPTATSLPPCWGHRGVSLGGGISR